jgi:ATP-dependent DNA helicase RecQ
VYESLKLLSKQHVIHYIPAQKVPTIYYVRSREEIEYLVVPQSVYEGRRDKLISRIKHVVEYGSSQTQCRSKMLLQYFGEKEAKDCGQCDVCLAKKRDEIGSFVKNKIPEEILKLLENGETTTEKIISTLDYPEKLIIDVLRFLSDNKRIRIKDHVVIKFNAGVSENSRLNP